MTPDRRAPALQIILLAAAGLYLELALIRFAPAEVLYLGYFSNFVLLSAFVGLALGFLAGRHRLRLDAYFPFALVFLVALILVSRFDVDFLRNRFGSYSFGERRTDAGLPGPVLLPLLFVASATLFAGIGQRIAPLFERFTPLVAYSLDVAGSLVGIAVFTLQASTGAGPPTWIVTALFLLCVAVATSASDGEHSDPHARRQFVHVVLGGACALLLLASGTHHGDVVWSPYQKLEYRQAADGSGEIYANGLRHQFLQSVSHAGRSYYGAPYVLQRAAGGPIDDVLIIGAGSGTDVSVALAYGARHIDAVEIDPAIQEMGAAHHPDHPYEDARVTPIITDGRAFLHNTTHTYDLIVLALPDSVILASPMSSIRLESHLFTLEAFREARAHLNPHGMFVLYNQYRWEWLRARIAATLAEAFGRPPQRNDYDTTTVFCAGPYATSQPLAAGDFEGLARDDWPFVYMQRRAIHWLYLAMIAMFLVVAAGGVFVLAPKGTLRRPEFTFFFMGAAFLLLETRSLALFALLFGSTWMVNAMAFGGVLLSVLAANALVQRVKIRRRWTLYVLLFASLAIAYAIPTARLLDVTNPTARFAAASVLVFTPVFVANVLFSREFESSEASARAFGWNILGAVLGGGLEYLSLMVGYRNLLVLAAGCYAAAAIDNVRRARHTV